MRCLLQPPLFTTVLYPSLPPSIRASHLPKRRRICMAALKSHLCVFFQQKTSRSKAPRCLSGPATRIFVRITATLPPFVVFLASHPWRAAPRPTANPGLVAGDQQPSLALYDDYLVAASVRDKQGSCLFTCMPCVGDATIYDQHPSVSLSIYTSILYIYIQMTQPFQVGILFLLNRQL